MASQFYYEGDMNPFADWHAEGSFLDRAYTFKAGFGDTIARVRRTSELVKDLDTCVTRLPPHTQPSLLCQQP